MTNYLYDTSICICIHTNSCLLVRNMWQNKNRKLSQAMINPLSSNGINVGPWERNFIQDFCFDFTNPKSILLKPHATIVLSCTVLYLLAGTNCQGKTISLVFSPCRHRHATHHTSCICKCISYLQVFYDLHNVLVHCH